LRALVADEGAHLTTEPIGIGVGAAALADDTVWALVDVTDGRSAARALGPVLAWALRQRARAVRLITEQDAAILARRAALFDWDIEVRELEGRVQRRAVAAHPLTAVTADDDRWSEWRELIEAAGAVPVVEHGVLAGEVAGLEVCRVVDGLQGAQLAVGIGAHDREMFQMIHGERPTLEALSDVVRRVAVHRDISAPQHPLNQLARSRLLRAHLIADPSPVGAERLVAADPPVVRSNVKDELPCVARAVDEAVVVVCSVGVDLDAVVFAADAAAMYGAARCLLAVPARDAVEIQHRLAELVRVPTSVVAVPN
jgi:hypothetical protein